MNAIQNSSLIDCIVSNLNITSLLKNSYKYYAILHAEFLEDAELIGFEALADNPGFIGLSVR